MVSRRECAVDGDAQNSKASDVLDVLAWRWHMNRLSALSMGREYDLLRLGTVELEIGVIGVKGRAPIVEEH